MISTKDHQQCCVFDPGAYLGPTRRMLREESWAGLFRRERRNNLPVREFAQHVQDGIGRPTQELFPALGGRMRQHLNDLADGETVEPLAFNTPWHVALEIADESDNAHYLGLKTLWNRRKSSIANGIDPLLFNQVADTPANAFSVDTSKQRLASVHLRPNMKRLGRIGLFVRCRQGFRANLKRQPRELVDSLPQEVVDKSPKKKSRSCFSMVTPSDAERTLAAASAERFELPRRFHDRPEVMAMSSFEQRLQVLEEQGLATTAPEGVPVEVAVNPAKDVSSGSRRNPAAPDVTDDGRKGQGYQGQVMETSCDTDNRESREKTLRLITPIELEPAGKSDVHALIPAIESTEGRGLAPMKSWRILLMAAMRTVRWQRKWGSTLFPRRWERRRKTGSVFRNFLFPIAEKSLLVPKATRLSQQSRKRADPRLLSTPNIVVSVL